MNPIWLLRMAKWARYPPSAGRMKLVFAVVLICLALYSVERWVGWPDWATAEKLRAPMRVNP